MKYFIKTYGCQQNHSDSERIASVLKNIGYSQSFNENEADLIIINACSVRKSAVDRVFGQTENFKKIKIINPKLKTVLTGCVLAKEKNKLAQKFDFIFDIKNLAELPKILGKKSEKNKFGDYLKIMPKYQSPFSISIPIMTGCNNFCSYCAVPYTRGKEISRPAEEIICEAKNAIKNGAKEIWLLGQNVNSYSGKQRLAKNKWQIINFSKLLKMVNGIPGNFWIRFTSPHPKDFSNELIKIMAKNKKVTPYLNLPAQSGDNEILRKMARPYTVKHYKNIIKKIRWAFAKDRKGLEKNIAISTDVIVGFPRETIKQFENTIKLFSETKFDMAYISKYSPRPGTAAEKIKDNISQTEKQKRSKILNDILKKTALKNNKKYVGKITEVLIEKQEKQFFTGKNRNYKTVRALNLKQKKAKTDLIGQFVKIRITDAMPWGLKGEFIGKKI